VRIARDTCSIVIGDRLSADDAHYELLRLPYALLPYLHSLAWSAVCHDMPLLRPLRYHFPDDAHACRADHQLMLGAWLVAVPASARAAQSRALYLPAGRWYDWWSGQVLDGPVQLDVSHSSDQPRLYVRAGAIVPTGPDAHLGDCQPLTLHLFPGNGSLTLYEPDECLFEPYRQRFCATNYRLRADAQHLRLTIGEREGSYVPERHRIRLCVHAVGEEAAASCQSGHYDAAWRSLSLVLNDAGRAGQLAFSLATI
jgi:alpha-glucosidase